MILVTKAIIQLVFRAKLYTIGAKNLFNHRSVVVYCQGYTSPREYIATQGPMMGTITDFWRMMWEQKSTVIVMLSDLTEKGRVSRIFFFYTMIRENTDWST